MNFWERYNPFSKYTGAQLIKTLGPAYQKKYRTPLLFNPSDKFSEKLFDDFDRHQSELIELLTALSHENFSKINMTSPTAGLITFPVQDAIQFILAHEKRHILQALKVKDDPSFPK
jgi:hypothetical protein